MRREGGGGSEGGVGEEWEEWEEWEEPATHGSMGFLYGVSVTRDSYGVSDVLGMYKTQTLYCIR